VTVWRGYDQAALDAQYSARGRIPGYDTYLPRWIAASAAVRAARRCVLDVAYGASERERLDVFIPDGAPGPRGRPVHVFFHGGYWQSMSRKEFAFPAPAFLDAGAVWIAADYALCPDVTMTALVAQCGSAVAFAHAHARDWGGDPARLFVSGHSAGGHITAVVASAAQVRGGLAISGLYDLEPIRRSHVNAKLRMDAAEAAALSPLLHVPPRAAPLAVAVGGDESEEFHRQQADFVARWRAPDRPVAVVDCPGLNHFSVMDDYAAGRLKDIALAQMGL
jgi:arylformamidase